MTAFLHRLGGSNPQARLWLRQGVASVVLKVVYTSLTLVTAILLARALGPSGYGVYAFAFAVMTILAIPAQSGIPKLAVREVAVFCARSEWSLLRGFLRWANAVVVLFSVGVIGLAVLVLIPLLRETASFERLTFALALALIPVIALGNLRGAAMRGLGYVARGQLPEQIVRPGVLAAAIAIALIAGGISPAGAMGLHLLAAGIAFAAGAWLLYRVAPPTLKDRPRPEYRRRSWLVAAVPLGLIGGAQIVSRKIDVFMLGIFVPPEDVGVYHAAAQSALVVGIVLASANMVVGPNIARLHAAGKFNELRRLITGSARWIALAVLPAAGIMLLFGEALLGLFFGPEFQRGYLAFAILVSAQIVDGLAGSVAWLLNMTGHERDTLVVVIGTALVNVMLNLALVPRFGMEGAAIATLVSMLVLNGALWLRGRQRLGIDTTALGWHASRGS